jgi:hypothetical protein
MKIEKTFGPKDFIGSAKGGFKSENVEGFSNLPKNIPKNYLKFVHPVHDIDKTSIVNFFDFTSLTYL